MDSQRTEGRKHRTMIPYQYNNGSLQYVRSRTKKLTVSFSKINTSMKDEKENTTSESQDMISSTDLMNNVKNNLSAGSALGQIKKSSISSSLFTPKRKS